MHKITGSLLLVISSALFLSACSTTGEPEDLIIEGRTPEAVYQDARQTMETGNFTKAAQLLEALDTRYPFGPHKTQVQLDLIYAYYKLDDGVNALANVDRFLRLNPTHKDIDYVYYMRGLINMQIDTYFFHELLDIERNDRDPSGAIAAFRDFDSLLQRYPNSRYAADAQRRMIMLKNRLADHGLSIAEYYVKMETWVAAANRAQQVLEQYPETSANERALEIMVQSYDALGLDEMRDNSLAILRANYPKNSLALTQ